MLARWYPSEEVTAVSDAAGAATARAGKLHALVGGKAEDLERARPVLPCKL